jgi:hypothetical protein
VDLPTNQNIESTPLMIDGMASFSEYLQPGDTGALRAYLISLAQAAQAPAR